MRLIVYGASALVCLVGVVCLVGWLLPPSHVATASATLDMTPDQVYDRVSNVGDYASWWKDYDPVPVKVEEAVRPRRLVTRIEPGLPFGGTWTFDIAPEGSGSRLTVTERGEVYNVLFRFVSRVFMSKTATMEKMLRALREHPTPGP